MPAKSQSQQKYMSLVYLYKKGKLDTSKFDDEFIDKIKKTADGISMKSVKHFAKTKRKNLPEKVKKESLNFDEFIQESKEDKLYNFNDFLNENTTIEIDIEFQNLFNKKYTYAERVLDRLVDISCDDNKISEKDFTRVDETIAYVNNLIKEKHEEIDTIIEEFEEKNSRINYCGETIYDKFFKNNKIEKDEQN
jgi:hypothetical protein